MNAAPSQRPQNERLRKASLSRVWQPSDRLWGLPQPRISLLVTLLLVFTWPLTAQLPTTLQGEDLEETSSPPPQEAPRAAAPSDGPVDAALLAELTDLERLAEESFAQDDLITAVALYRQLADRHTSRDEKTRIMMVVAWLQHQQDRPMGALQTLTDVLLLDPDYVFRPNLYSDDFAPIFYDAKRRAQQTREAEASTLTRQGSDLMRAGRYDEARNAFDQALELVPRQVEAIYNRALADYHQSRGDDALDGFQRVLALAAADPASVAPTLRSSALTNQALIYLERGQTQEAEEALQEAVAVDPDNAAAWLNLGTAQRRLARHGEATGSLQKAYALDSSNVDAGRKLALAYLDAGDPGSAANLLTDLAGRAPSDAGIQLYLGMAKKALDDRPGATAAFEAAAGRDPDNRDGWGVQAALQLATIYYLEADYHGTRRQAERVTQWLPEQANGWVYLALAEQSLGRLDDAREHLEAALRIAPTRPDIHNSLGSVQFERGDYAAAEKAFLRALELDPSMAGAQANLDALRRVQSGRAVAGRGGSGRSGSDRSRSAQTGKRTLPDRSSPPPRPPRAAPSRPAPADLGWRFSEVDYASLGLQGVMVETVQAGSAAAAAAGLQADDLLLKIDGRAVGTADELRRYAAGRASGDVLVLELLRNNRPASARLTVP